MGWGCKTGPCSLSSFNQSSTVSGGALISFGLEGHKLADYVLHHCSGFLDLTPSYPLSIDPFVVPCHWCCHSLLGPAAADTTRITAERPPLRPTHSTRANLLPMRHVQISRVGSYALPIPFSPTLTSYLSFWFRFILGPLKSLFYATLLSQILWHWWWGKGKNWVGKDKNFVQWQQNLLERIWGYPEIYIFQKQ